MNDVTEPWFPFPRDEKIEWISAYTVGLSDYVIAEGTHQWIELRPYEPLSVLDWLRP